MTALSIIVPTYNRATMLADVLEGLAAQDAAADLFEVVVVDDGSTDGTAEIVSRATAGSDRPIRYVHQANAGLNAARNKGAAESRGGILVYLDDDVLLPPHYATSMADAFARHAEADAVAGRIRLQLEGPEPDWLTPSLRLYLSELDRGDNEEVLSAPEYPRGANFGLRRSALQRVGQFKPGLDRRGGSLISSGEQELFLRLHRAGGTILYAPQAEVLHRVPAERLTLDWFSRRARAQGTSDAVLAGARRRAADVGREVLRAGRTLPIAARGVASGRGLVNARLWAAYCRGRLAATWGAGR
jgi:glucosyl-dolichyl phosphate glucuronosyltransferase